MPRIGIFLPTPWGAFLTLLTSGCRTSIGRSCLVALAVALTGVELGCSHLRSRPQKTAAGPATLGVELPGQDIYAARTPTGGDLIATSRTPTTALLAHNDASPATTSAASPATTGATAVAHQEPPTSGNIAADTPKLTGINSSATPLPTSSPRPEPTDLMAASQPRSTSQLIGEARAVLDAMTTYQLALKRQERVNGTLLPAEDLIMSIRRNPKATRLTWADGPHRGREVLYRADEPGGLMHVNMADSKFPMPRLSLAPESPMVMKNSRHPITEAGLDPIVASLEQADQAGTLVDLGMQTPAQLDHPHHALLRTTAEGDVWHAYIDPINHLPMLVDCQDRHGELLEEYRFREFQPNPPELASSGAFDPDVRWGAPRGLFGRVAARNGDSSSGPTTR